MKSTAFSFFCLLTVAHGALRTLRDSGAEQEQTKKRAERQPAPERRRLNRLKHGEIIPGSYIVTMKQQADPTELAKEFERSFRKPLRKILRSAIKGFIFDNLTEEEAALIRARDDVRRVEKDRVVSLESATERNAIYIHEPDSGSFHSAIFDVTPMQQNPDTAEVDGHQLSTQQVPWGIERVNGGEKYRGDNVAWILDSGIDLNHPDLNVETERCFSAFNRILDMTCDDRNGHGTQ